MTDSENNAEVDLEKKTKPKIKPKPKPKSSSFKAFRILIIEPRGKYCRMVWYAIGLGVSQIMIGATVMTVLIYSLSNNDWHAALHSFGYHLFSAEAILSLNYANGWSTPMRLRHRRLTHAFLQVCAMSCAITGTVLITLSNGISTTPHGLTGLVTAALAVITFLMGLCALFGNHLMKMVHATFGMPTFAMSSVSFCFGLFTPAFKSWAPAAVIYVLIGFITFYTIVIMAMCFIKCTSRI